MNIKPKLRGPKTYLQKKKSHWIKQFNFLFIPTAKNELTCDIAKDMIA